MSPRPQFIVRSHFRVAPILGKSGQPTPQIGSLGLIDPSCAQIYRARRSNPRHAVRSPQHY